jgi:tartrate-resistant acid phosphatase type 5
LRQSIQRVSLLSVVIAVTVLAVPLACAHRDGGTSPSTTRATSKPASRPVVAKWSQRPLPEGEVNLIVFGDFGNGKPSQRETARAMAEYCAKVKTQFHGLLTVGDNFYVKMKDADDWQFQTLFEDMYDARRINFPWYVTSGNHDYERTGNGQRKVDVEMEYARRNPQSRWKYPAKYYRVDFPQGSAKPLLMALMLESSMPNQSREEWAAQKRWIAEQLATSNATWKVACAHHPFFSNGSHGDNGVLQREWGPLFKAGGLNAYIAGHDHDLQHLELRDWPFSFIQAGGGGQPVTDMRRDVRGPFSRKLHGFAHVRVTPETMEVRYVASRDGKVTHYFERDRDGTVTILSSSGHDKATTKPLKTLIGVAETDVKKPATKPETKK